MPENKCSSNMFGIVLLKLIFKAVLGMKAILLEVLGAWDKYLDWGALIELTSNMGIFTKFWDITKMLNIKKLFLTNYVR